MIHIWVIYLIQYWLSYSKCKKKITIFPFILSSTHEDSTNKKVSQDKIVSGRLASNSKGRLPDFWKTSKEMLIFDNLVCYKIRQEVKAYSQITIKWLKTNNLTKLHAVHN